MTSSHKTRRDWLADVSSALLLSTTAYSTAATGIHCAANRQKWPSAPVMASIASCGVAAEGQILAIGWLMSPGGQGVQRALLAIGPQREKHATIVPTAFPPEAIVPLSTGKLLVVDEDQGVTPFGIDGGRWRRGTRRVLPLRSDWGSAALMGCRILMAAERKLAAVDLEPTGIRWIREDVAPTALAVASPETLLCALRGGAIIEISADTGRTKRVVGLCHDDVSQMAVGPRAELLACRTKAGGIEVRSLHNGQRLWVQREHGSIALPTSLRPKLCGPALGFSPDGADLVTAASEPEWVLATWDAHTGERLQTLRGHDDQINGAAYLPDGTLLSWSADSTLRWWDTHRGVAQRKVSIREFLPC